MFALVCQIELIPRLWFCHEPDQVNEDILVTVIVCLWRVNIVISCNSGISSTS